jgi:hypothetical protein
MRGVFPVGNGDIERENHGRRKCQIGWERKTVLGTNVLGDANWAVVGGIPVNRQGGRATFRAFVERIGAKNGVRQNDGIKA